MLENDNNPDDKAIKYLRITIGACSVIYIIIYIVTALFRMNYPFELEWMEGGTLVNSHRIISGEGIYVRPSPEYAPYFYTPFYYYLSAFASKIMGEGFFAPRLLSFLFSIGNLAWLFALVRARTGSVLGGLAAAGVFAAAYRMTGTWYDLGRIDSMFLFFLLGGAYFMLSRSGMRSAALAGVFVAISYFTKQTAFAVAFWIFMHELLRSRPRAVTFLVSMGAPMLIGTIIFDTLSDDWYSYVTRRLMLNQHYLLASIYKFWASDVLLSLPICAGLAGVGFYRALRSGRRADAWIIILLGAGWVGASWLSRINVGGYRNVLIPAVAYASVIFGCSIPATTESLRGKYTALFYGLLLFQLALFQFDFPSKTWNNPFRWIPTDADKQAGDNFVEELKQIEGDVLISNHPYLLLMAGKKLCAHTAGVDDVLRGDDGRVKDELLGEIRRRIEVGEYAAIVLEREWIFRRDVEKHYQFSRKIFADDQVFWPITGWRTRPEEIWVPKSASNEIH